MVWFEISTTRGRSLPTGNHYAPRPANKPDVISKYFCVLDKNLDTNNHSVLRLIISVLLTFNCWAICLNKLSFLCKIKGDEICTQLTPLVLLSTYRMTHFQQFHSVSTLFAAFGVVKPIAGNAYWHWYALCTHNSKSHHEHSYSKYALADCSLIFSFLSKYDRSCVCSKSTVGVAAHCFTDVILQAIDLAIPQVSLDSSNSLTAFLIHWFLQAIQQKYKPVLLK